MHVQQDIGIIKYLWGIESEAYFQHSVAVNIKRK